MKIGLKTISSKQLKSFVRGHYFSDEDETVLWEPFEYGCYEKEQIEEFIDSDLWSLQAFLKIPVKDRI